MKRVVLGIVATAALLSIPGQPAMSQGPSRQQSPRIEMPDEPVAGPEADTAPRHRARRKRTTGASPSVDRSVANGFTHQLNGQVLESLGRSYPPQ